MSKLNSVPITFKPFKKLLLLLSTLTIFKVYVLVIPVSLTTCIVTVVRPFARSIVLGPYPSWYCDDSTSFLASIVKFFTLLDTDTLYDKTFLLNFGDNTPSLTFSSFKLLLLLLWSNLSMLIV